MIRITQFSLFFISIQGQNGTFLSNQLGEFEENLGLRRLSHVRSMLKYLYCKDQTDCDISNRDIVKSIDNYACNCYSANKRRSISDNNKRSRYPGINSKPMNRVDEICTQLAHRLKCFEIDLAMGLFLASEEKYDCNWATSYSWHIGESGEIVCGPESSNEYVWYTNDGEINEGRTDRNECRNALCQIEREFSLAIFEEIKDPISFFKAEKLLGNYGAWQDTGKCRYIYRLTGLTNCIIHIILYQFQSLFLERRLKVNHINHMS